MGRGTLKLLVLALGLAAGIVLLTNGFDGGLDLSVGGDTGGEESPSPTPTTPTTTTPAPTCQRQGTIVAVYNGTPVTGLAASTQAKLQGEGYVIQEVGNASSDFQITALYYRDAQGRAEARCLRTDFFPGAQIQRLVRGSGVPGAVQVAIYLGSDYAAANPVA